MEALPVLLGTACAGTGLSAAPCRTTLERRGGERVVAGHERLSIP